jgi:hypothetical protein
VDEIEQACRSLSKLTLPRSMLGKAVTYTLNMWPKLVRCFDYAEVELSNNLAENSMRPIALGRKNWLHVGSVKAGPKVAAILSIVESWRRLAVPVKEYNFRRIAGARSPDAHSGSTVNSGALVGGPPVTPLDSSYAYPFSCVRRQEYLRE